MLIYNNFFAISLINSNFAHLYAYIWIVVRLKLKK